MVLQRLMMSSGCFKNAAMVSPMVMRGSLPMYRVITKQTSFIMFAISTTMRMVGLSLKVHCGEDGWARQ